MLFGACLGGHFSFASFTGVIRKTQNSKPSRLRMEGRVFSLQFTSSSGLKKNLCNILYFQLGFAANYCFPFLQEKLYLTTIFLLVSPGGCLFSHPSCEIDDVSHLFYSLLFQKRKGQLFLMLAVLSLYPVDKTEYT